MAVTLTLDEVNQAIKDILLAGQSYNRPDLQLQRAQLSELRSLRRELLLEKSRKTDGIQILSDFSGVDRDFESDDFGDNGVAS